MSIIGAAGIAAGASILGGLLGSASSSNLNSKNQRFQREMLANQQAYNDKVIAQQLAYQDKVNRQNFEWNSEVNQRRRIENAGYNPYLYNNPNTASAQGSSIGSGSASLGNGVVSDSSALLGNSVGSAMNTFLGALSQMQDIKGKTVAVDQADYNFTQQKANDSKVINGVSAYDAPAIAKVSQARDAQFQANISANKAFIDNINTMFMSSNAVDENGQLVTDEAGTTMSNAEYSSSLDLRSKQKALDKLQSELNKNTAEISKLSVDEALQRFNLVHLKPLEKQQFIEQFNLWKSQVNSNNASAVSSIANAGYTDALRTTEDGIRRYRVSGESWRANDAKWSSKVRENDYRLRDQDWQNDIYGRAFKNSWGYRSLRMFGSAAGDLLGTGVGPALKYLKW